LLFGPLSLDLHQNDLLFGSHAWVLLDARLRLRCLIWLCEGVAANCWRSDCRATRSGQTKLAGGNGFHATALAAKGGNWAAARISGIRCRWDIADWVRRRGTRDGRRVGEFRAVFLEREQLNGPVIVEFDRA